MFAWKQKAFSIPTRNELNNLWLRARKKVGNAERVYVPLDSAAKKFAELSVQCYRTSAQPKWQFQPENAGPEASRALISSDLSTVSAWISECLNKLRVVEISARRQLADGDRQSENSLWNSPDGSLTFTSSSSATGTFEALYTEHLPIPVGDAAQNKAANKVESYYWQGLISNARWTSCHSLRSAAIINASKFEVKNGRLAINRSLVASSYEFAKTDSQARPDSSARPAILKADAALNLVSVRRKRNQFSQSNLNRKLKRSGRQRQIVFCLELLRLLDHTTTLASIIERSELAPESLLSAASILNRLGYIELAEVDELSELDRQDSIIDFAPSNDYPAAGTSTSNRNAISFVLLESQLSSTHRRLMELVTAIKGKDDTISEAGEGQLLVAIRSSKSTDAAHFVRRLRRTISKSGIKDCGQTGAPEVESGAGSGPTARLVDTLFLSSIVCAPEDGATVAELLGKARLALQVNKQIGHKWPNVTQLEPWEKQVIELQRSRKAQAELELAQLLSPCLPTEAQNYALLFPEQKAMQRQQAEEQKQQAEDHQRQAEDRQRQAEDRQRQAEDHQRKAEVRKKETEERLKKYDSALAELFGSPILVG